MHHLFDENLHLLVPSCNRNCHVRLTLLDESGGFLEDATVGMDGLHDFTNLEIRGISCGCFHGIHGMLRDLFVIRIL